MKKEQFYLEKAGKAGFRIEARVFSHPEVFKPISNPVGWNILSRLSAPKCPIDIARELGIHEQKVYYYINRFRKAGLIEEVKSEQRKGTFARFYRLSFPAFGVILDKNKSLPGDSEKMNLPGMEPFISNGSINSTIIVGSPDPHGPWKARASDSCCAIDLALFMGSFLRKRVSPNYKLDVEAREADLKKNLILVGGPAVNTITNRVNDFLPLHFDVYRDKDIISRDNGSVHRDDECGVVEIIRNPLNPEARILVLAGKRFAGTRAAVIAWMKHMEDFLEFQDKEGLFAKVVKGSDMDGDGVIDSADIVK